MPTATLSNSRGCRILAIVGFVFAIALVMSQFPVYRGGYTRIRESIPWTGQKQANVGHQQGDAPPPPAEEKKLQSPPVEDNKKPSEPAKKISWAEQFLTDMSATFKKGSAQLTCDQRNLELPQRVQQVKSGIDTNYKMFLHRPGVDIHISEQLWNNGVPGGVFFETHFQTMYADHLKRILGDKKGIVMDIGANIGTHAMFFASLGHKVIAFEPFQTNFRLLQCSAWLNEFSNLYLFPAALAAEVSDGDKCVVTPDQTNAGHTVVSTECEASANMIRTLTVDQVWERVLKKQQVNYIKIDIEGYEPIALSGAKKMLTEAPPPIITGEYTPSSSVTAGFKEPEQYIYKMMDYGYAVYENSVEWNKEIAKSKTTALLQNAGLTDLVFIHNSFKN